MIQKPFYNALGAAAYIILGVCAMENLTLSETATLSPLLAPIALLSILVLSTAVMGYFFVYQPVALLIEGKHKEALRFFLSTIGLFAVFTAITLGATLLVR